MVPLIAFICVLKPVRQRKKISIEKHQIFLFQVFDFLFFTKIFILQQCLNPNRNFIFGFGSSQNIRIISNSDPQYWYTGTGRSLPHTWYPERQLIGTLNSHTQLQLDSKVRGLAYRKHWRPEHKSSQTGRFLLAAALNCLILLVQCQLININKLASGEEQGPSS
jgi:hypothetical protein